MADIPANLPSPSPGSGVTTAVHFDPNGDLELQVGKNKVSIRVSSRLLEYHSIAFKEMLDQDTDNSLTPDGKRILQLPDDDINAITYIMHIVYSQSVKVPAKLPVRIDAVAVPDSYDFKDYFINTDLLYLISMTAEKYDLLSNLSDRAQGWLAQVYSDERWNTEWCGEVLSAAWFLGDEGLLVSQLKLVIASAMPRIGTVDDDATVTSELFVEDVHQDRIYASDSHEGADEILDIVNIWGMSFRNSHPTILSCN